MKQLLLALAVVVCLASTSGCAGFFVNTDTTTALASSATDATYGTSITLTATVTQQSSTTAPTGTVTFYDGSTSLGTGTLSSNVATLAVSDLAVGTHSITAVYGGDSNYTGSTSAAVSVIISAALTTTTTTLVASPTSATSGTAVVLLATVSSTAVTGTVQFYDGSTLLGTVTVAVGSASLTTTTLPVGTDELTAVYSGDGTYATSTSSEVAVGITQ